MDNLNSLKKLAAIMSEQTFVSRAQYNQILTDQEGGVTLEADKVFKAIDRNGDDVWSFSEYVAATKTCESFEGIMRSAVGSWFEKKQQAYTRYAGMFGSDLGECGEVKVSTPIDLFRHRGLYVIESSDEEIKSYDEYLSDDSVYYGDYDHQLYLDDKEVVDEILKNDEGYFAGCVDSKGNEVKSFIERNEDEERQLETLLEACAR